MPELKSAGVVVTIGRDKLPPGTSSMIVETADGEVVEVPEPVGPPMHFELRLFVDLDDGRRVSGDGRETADMGLSMPIVGLDGSRMTSDEFEADVRRCVFDDELREIEEELRAEDPDVLIGPDWRRLIPRLSELGVRASGADLEALPFAVECDSEVTDLLRD